MNFVGKSIIILSIIAFVSGILYLIFSNDVIGDIRNSFSSSCITKTENKIIRGNSLYPLIQEDHKIKILYDFYECHDVKRGDMILYNYSSSRDPLIKIVKGIPGDSFALQRQNDGNWYILINNRIVTNSEDKPYILDDNSMKILSLYERDYRGFIPTGAYLILGDNPRGSLDSTRFGFIDKNDIIGKVFY